MTRGDQRNRNRDKAQKKKTDKHILPNNKVGKTKTTESLTQKGKYFALLTVKGCRDYEVESQSGTGAQGC